MGQLRPLNHMINNRFRRAFQPKENHPAAARHHRIQQGAVDDFLEAHAAAPSDGTPLGLQNFGEVAQVAGCHRFVGEEDVVDAVLLVQGQHLISQGLGAQLAEGFRFAVAHIAEGTLAKIAASGREQRQSQPRGQIAIQRQIAEIGHRQIGDLLRLFAGGGANLCPVPVDQIGNLLKVPAVCHSFGQLGQGAFPVKDHRAVDQLEHRWHFGQLLAQHTDVGTADGNVALQPGLPHQPGRGQPRQHLGHRRDGNSHHIRLFGHNVRQQNAPVDFQKNVVAGVFHPFQQKAAAVGRAIGDIALQMQIGRVKRQRGDLQALGHNLKVAQTNRPVKKGIAAQHIFGLLHLAGQPGAALQRPADHLRRRRSPARRIAPGTKSRPHPFHRLLDEFTGQNVVEDLHIQIPLDHLNPLLAQPRGQRGQGQMGHCGCPVGRKEQHHLWRASLPRRLGGQQPFQCDIAVCVESTVHQLTFHSSGDVPEGTNNNERGTQISQRAQISQILSV